MGTVWIFLMGQSINLLTVAVVVMVLGYWNKVTRQNLKDDLRSTVAEMMAEINRIRR